VAVGDQALDAVEVDHLRQQRVQRRVVQQRARTQLAHARDRPAHGHHREPARAGADHAERVGAIDLLDMHVLPHPHELGDAGVGVVGVGGQRGRVERAGRGAGQHRIGVAGRRPGLAPDAVHGAQHADLVGGASAAAREDQASGGCSLHGRSIRDGAHAG